ncbi:hypothetical protein IE81DRAFT_15033 [Ceraceosorus guamensis]|uniref:Mediator of RNA polymerase II transcription subunit 4 n=1 Tax=Ceraceosorus guamensis TaxID=1522189 RepID=A0A316VPW6_9BASI|nr:hypothetical protein IE81DRAFT_15033 [Ceraceosorus guamensis]PWN39626.1 hypothetical protein IE81DRAFT_15033 [Ceraceosorus guamensis]
MASHQVDLDQIALKRVLLDLLDHHAELSHALLTSSTAVVDTPESIRPLLSSVSASDYAEGEKVGARAGPSTEKDSQVQDTLAQLQQADRALRSLLPFISLHRAAHDSLAQQTERVHLLSSQFSKAFGDVNDLNTELGDLVRNAKAQVKSSTRATKRPLNVEHLLSLASVVGYQTSKPWGSVGSATGRKKAKVNKAEASADDRMAEDRAPGVNGEEAPTVAHTNHEPRTLSRSPTPAPQHPSQLEQHLPYPSQNILRSGSLGSDPPSWNEFRRQRRLEMREVGQEAERTAPEEHVQDANGQQEEVLTWTATQRERGRADEDAFSLDL